MICGEPGPIIDRRRDTDWGGGVRRQAVFRRPAFGEEHFALSFQDLPHLGEPVAKIADGCGGWHCDTVVYHVR